jgi:PHD/YefM family antitoxin component YafN of YafNO toxin-antitoxin module
MKSQITLGNQAIDDVKVYFSALVILTKSMYVNYIDADDYEAMQEDIAKLLVNMVLQGDVLKVLVCLLRIDYYD